MSQRGVWMTGVGAWIAVSSCAQVAGVSGDYHALLDAAAGEDGAAGGGMDAAGGSAGDASVEGDGPREAEAAAACDGGAEPMGAFGGPCCNQGELACGGHAQKLVLICDPVSKKWTALQSCSGNQLCDTTLGADQGSCQDPITLCIGKQPGDRLCDGLKAVQCGPDLVTLSAETSCQYVCAGGECSGECGPDTKKCSGNLVQTCQASGQWDVGTACGEPTPVCTAGSCVARPSCTAISATCGLSGNVDCCASSVLTGGQFDRDNNATYPATVSDFRMDRYEITVGRFRKFVGAWVSGWRPAAGAGKHTHLNGGAGLAATGGGNEAGWDSAWSSGLATTSSGWDTNLMQSATNQTWTSSVGSNEHRPINYVTWFEAYAFCIWDGGFLPSEAEWNYAAAGGGGTDGQRQYPWSVPSSSTTIDDSYAVYCGDSCSITQGVGMKSPKGDGKWGQSDLAGNVWEWAVDWFASPYLNPCTNCADAAASSGRVIRGGGFSETASDLLSKDRLGHPPSNRYRSVGARCVRSP